MFQFLGYGIYIMKNAVPKRVIHYMIQKGNSIKLLLSDKTQIV